MKAIIYYFSGTGNCLSIARKIAASLEDSMIVCIAKIVNKSYILDVTYSSIDRIGFVFPTYAYGLPNIVRDFLKNTYFNRNAYFFAITSNFGIPGTTLYQSDRLLKNNKCKLDAGFAVLNPASSLIDDPKDLVQRFMISINRGRKPAPSSERMDEIIHIIKGKLNHPLESSSGLVNFFGTILYSLAIGFFKSSGKFFWTMDSCNSCGTCTKVCPRKNINLVKGRPAWGDNCELCHACIQACPQLAIQYKNLTEGKPRYRNPEVNIKDLMLG